MLSVKQLSKYLRELSHLKYYAFSWGTGVAQSVKHPTLDFCSGHDLRVCEFEPCIGLSADSAEPAWGSLSPSLSLPLPWLMSLSLTKK